MSKQAVSKARQGIKPSLFQELFNLASDIFYANINNRKTWHGYHIYAIDGTKLQLPNSKSNFEDFGQMFSPHNHERTWSMALGSIVYDVLEDFIIHGSIHYYLASERAAATHHLISLEALDIYKDSIVIFDRGYYSERLFRYCYDHGHMCLMRLKENYKIAKSCHSELITTLPGDPKTGSPDIKIRVIEVILDDGSKEYLATNRTFIVGRVRKYFSRIVLGFDEINVVEKIFQKACKCRSQIQPRRKNKRPRIERKRTHFRNRKVTCQLHFQFNFKFSNRFKGLLRPFLHIYLLHVTSFLNLSGQSEDPFKAYFMYASPSTDS